MDLRGLKDITVKAGMPLKIVVPYTGFPAPTATWELNGEPISESTRTRFEVNVPVSLHQMYKLHKAFFANVTDTMLPHNLSWCFDKNMVILIFPLSAQFFNDTLPSSI